MPWPTPPDPTEIIANNNAQLMGIVNNYVQNQRAIAQQQREHEMAQQLLAQRLEGEQRIAKWHETAAQIRSDAQEKIWDKRIQAQAAAAASAEKARLESLGAAEMAREARDFATGKLDSRTGLFIPPVPRLPNESDSAYVVRAGTERAKDEAARQGLIDKNTAVVSGRMNELVTKNEAQNKAFADSAGKQAVATFIQNLPVSAGGKFGFGTHNPQMDLKTNLKKLLSAGVPYEDALAQIENSNPTYEGLTQAYTGARDKTMLQAQSIKNPVLETQLTGLNTLLKNPAALSRSDFGKVLEDVMPPNPGTSSAPAAQQGAPAGVPNLKNWGVKPSGPTTTDTRAATLTIAGPTSLDGAGPLNWFAQQNLSGKWQNSGASGRAAAWELSKQIADKFGIKKDDPGLQIGSSVFSHDPAKPVFTALLGGQWDRPVGGRTINAQTVRDYLTSLPTSDQMAMYRRSLGIPPEAVIGGVPAQTNATPASVSGLGPTALQSAPPWPSQQEEPDYTAAISGQ